MNFAHGILLSSEWFASEHADRTGKLQRRPRHYRLDTWLAEGESVPKIPNQRSSIEKTRASQIRPCPLSRSWYGSGTRASKIADNPPLSPLSRGTGIRLPELGSCLASTECCQCPLSPAKRTASQHVCHQHTWPADCGASKARGQQTAVPVKHVASRHRLASAYDTNFKNP